MQKATQNSFGFANIFGGKTKKQNGGCSGAKKADDGFVSENEISSTRQQCYKKRFKIEIKLGTKFPTREQVPTNEVENTDW